MYDAIFIEEHGKPTATFVFEHFLNDVMSAASSRGMPLVRVVAETIVSESTVVPTIEAAITAVACASLFYFGLRAGQDRHA